MVHKFEDLSTGLRQQVASTAAERDQLRSELINRSNLMKASRKPQVCASNLQQFEQFICIYVCTYVTLGKTLKMLGLFSKTHLHTYVHGLQMTPD
jgi:hypothetical protein